MKVLITGSKGFIGQATRKQFEQRGHEVVSYDLSDGDDVLDVANLEAKITEVDGVIHFAGLLGTDKLTMNSELGRKALEVNIIGGFNVIEACTKLKKRLITLDNGNWWMANVYSASKHMVNQVVRAYAKSRGLNADIVRAYNVYGEGQSMLQNKFAPNWIVAALKDEPLLVYGSGEQQLDPIYSEDVAQIIFDVYEDGEGRGETFEAGSGLGWKAKAFAQFVIDLTNSTSQIEFVPMRAGEDDYSVVVAQNPYLPFNALTDLKSSMLKTIEYYKAQIQ